MFRPGVVRRKRESGGRPPTVHVFVVLVLVFGATGIGAARQYKYTTEERILLTRDLTAEFATARVTLPRSKKALPVDSEGKIDQERWTDAQEKYGAAARMGDLVQITKIKFEGNRIVLEINGGFKGGRKWYERIQIGGSTGTVPIARSRGGNQPAGTKLALMFPDGIPELQASQIKEMLKPILDFEKHTATEQYIDTLPEPMQAAIKEKRAIEGMNHEAVMLALGRPNHKVRETKNGEELEDWIYGQPPGKITFVTFSNGKVVKVKVAYAGLGGSVAVTPPPQ